MEQLKSKHTEQQELGVKKENTLECSFVDILFDVL